MKPTTVEDVIEQTAACLNRLAADRTEIEAAGTCAREAAEQTWSWDRLREQMLNLYREIV
jgi:glycosyltransferase involved in cell wall biosynthesis